MTIARTMRVLGRVVVSVGCALAVVGIASRVNRPARLAIVEETPRVADIVLAEVRWDANSFRSAIESIQKAAPPGVIVVEWDSLRDFDVPADPRYLRPVVRLRNVRVGTLLHLPVNPFHAGSPDFVQEPGRIVVRGPSVDRQVTLRLYDLRRILGPATDGGSWDGYGQAMAEFVRLISFEFETGDLGWSADGCGRWLLVRASNDGHRAVEELLLLIGRGDLPGGEAGAR